jgi:hypothetical protein
MPGATPVYAIPYPLQNEAIDAAAFAAMAQRIDLLVGDAETKAGRRAIPPMVVGYQNAGATSVAPAGTGATNITSAVTTETGMFQSATQIRAVTSGLYMVGIDDYSGTPYTTITSFYWECLVNGVFQFGERHRYGAAAPTPKVSFHGIADCRFTKYPGVTPLLIVVNMTWTGTGGPLVLANGTETPSVYGRLIVEAA